MFSIHRLLAFSGLLLLLPGVRAEEVVTLANGEWPPYLSEKLPYYGPVSRIVTEAFALEGVRVQYVFRPWSRAYAEAAADNFNGTLVWSVSLTDDDRRRRFALSDVVLEASTVFFHQKNFPFRWTGPASLEKLRVGGTAGYEYLFDKDPRVQIDKSAPTDELNFRKLAAGRFDVFPADLNAGRYIMRSTLTPAQAALLTWDPHPYNVTAYHLLLNRKNPANARYVALFNKGLKRLRDSGKYAEYLRELK